MTPHTETTVLASLALAAQQYADPRPIYDALRELRPDVDWTDWISLVEDTRQKMTALSSHHVARFVREESRDA